MAAVDPRIGIELADRMSAAASAADRSRIVEEYEARLGMSAATIYRIAKAHGWESGRKQRADAGTYRCDLTDEQIRTLAAMQVRATRANGNRTMPTWVAQLHASDNGRAPADVSPATINRHMRRLNIGTKAQRAPQSTWGTRSLYPNHVHQVDASICIQWRFSGKAEKGPSVPRDMRLMYYKNKPEYFRKVKKVLIRYALVDHCSGAFYWRYFYESGESRELAVEFLLEAWANKDLPNYPFHGVPKLLISDKGSGFENQFCENLFARLGVEFQAHEAGHPWAKGSIESHHWLIERFFESSLSLKAAENLDELNARAWDMMAYLNACKPHSRTGSPRSRYWAWKVGDLRELPPIEVCKALARSAPVERTVKGGRKVGFKGNEYQLRGGTFVGDKVMVDYSPYEWPQAIRCWRIADGVELAATLVKTDEHGFDVRGQVWGDRSTHKRHAFNQAERLRADLDQGRIDLSGITPKPQAGKVPKIAMPQRTGAPVFPEQHEPEVFTAYAALKRLRELLGRNISPIEHQ
ncbi:MAG: hypothetical protein P9M14_16520, partial [Candidatus Alcyoniella australis]|nr:hypothetical protein [Candidatus Alcyoniella australis]